MASPEEMMSAVTDSMKERTGRDVAEWVAVVQGSGVDPLDQKAVRAYLKDEHGLKQNTQWAVAFAAAEAAGWRMPTVAEFVEQQYAGPKAALRPIYDRLAAAALGLGGDVSAEGRGGYIPFVRNRQFAAVAVPSRQRVELGLRFADPPPSARLVPASAPGQATHKLSLTTPDEVDTEVLALLEAAYQQN
jgi:predicted transport protein